MLKGSKSFLRLCFHKRLQHVSISSAAIKTEQKHEKSTQNKTDDLPHELKDRLLFSTYLERLNENYGRRQDFFVNLYKKKDEAKRNLQMQLDKPLAISLKYLPEARKYLPEKEESYPEIENITDKIDDSLFQLPFKKPENPRSWMKDYDLFDDTKLEKETQNQYEHSNFENEANKQKYEFASRNKTIYSSEELELCKNLNETDESKSHIRTDDRASVADEVELSDEEDSESDFYGTPDPEYPVSNVSCGGCGALLHCRDSAMPGYLPSEIFKGQKTPDLKRTICQRCHFLKEYNVALNVSVEPEEYPKLLEQIKSKRALAVLLVDLLDLPCSVWPGMADIIGKQRPVILVGNKVDLLPQDSQGYLKHVATCLRQTILDCNLSEINIKQVALISAKTGYGVEELITTLHNTWQIGGDVYLIGCTNVGKSTLFNALLRSDYCKVEASDLIQRATISQWPGTTLNLLKFPILRPAAWRVVTRTRRLLSEAASRNAENTLRRQQLKQTNDVKYATLMGHIGQTFYTSEKARETGLTDPHSYNMKSGFTATADPVGISEKSRMYAESRWCYDTPGVIHPDQVLNLLTLDELMLTLPKSLIRPRTFSMRDGLTLFIAGLARLDFITVKPIRLTVFSSHHLPITVCDTKDANEVYERCLNTPYFAVPSGNAERLEAWPGLQRSENKIDVIGWGFDTATSDIVLSSVGWVSIAGVNGKQCSVVAWTPLARGIHVRSPALIQHAGKLKGDRIKGTPAYRLGKFYTGVELEGPKGTQSQHDWRKLNSEQSKESG